MPQQGIGLHHFNVRKRIHKKHEPYPHPKKFINFFDKYIILVAIIIPVMTIPQVIKIWINKSASDLSLISWTAFLISAVSWLIYSTIHKEKALILNSILWITLYILIIAGVLLFS